MPQCTHIMQLNLLRFFPSFILSFGFFPIHVVRLWFFFLSADSSSFPLFNCVAKTDQK